MPVTRTIWKFPLPEIGVTSAIELPGGAAAQAIHVGRDPEGVPSIWFELNPNHTVGVVHIATVGTGQPVPDRMYGGHVGSFTIGPFVGHVYRR